MNRYNHFPGDYARDTSDLNLTEHGAYRMLLDCYYSKEEPISHQKRHRIAGAHTAKEKRAVDAVLDRFFERENDVWRHRRADEEIEKASGIIQRNRHNGGLGGRPKKNQTVPPGLPQTEPRPEPKENPDQNPNTKPPPPPPPPPLATADAVAKPRNLEEALRVPVRERSQTLVEHPEYARWLEPHKWPEVADLASDFSRAMGWHSPRFTKVTKAVTRMVELLASYSPQELAQAVRAGPDDDWLTEGTKGLTALTVDVVGQLLNPKRPKRSEGKRQPDYDGERSFSAAKLFADGDGTTG